MSRICFGIAALLFAFAILGVHIIPNPTGCGLFMTALGLAVGGWTLPSFKRPVA